MASRLFRFAMIEFYKFIPSQRGGQLLVDTDGHIYSKRQTLKNYEVWFCRKSLRSKKTQQAILSCPAKLYLVDTENLTLIVAHNHEATTGRPEALEVNSALKRKAADQALTPTQNIVSEVLSTYQHGDHLLAKMKNLSKAVQRARQIPEEGAQNFLHPP